MFVSKNETNRAGSLYYGTKSDTHMPIHNATISEFTVDGVLGNYCSLAKTQQLYADNTYTIQLNKHASRTTELPTTQERKISAAQVSIKNTESVETAKKANAFIVRESQRKTHTHTYTHSTDTSTHTYTYTGIDTHRHT